MDSNPSVDQMTPRRWHVKSGICASSACELSLSQHRKLLAVAPCWLCLGTDPPAEPPRHPTSANWVKVEPGGCGREALPNRVGR